MPLLKTEKRFKAIRAETYCRSACVHIEHVSVSDTMGTEVHLERKQIRFINRLCEILVIYNHGARGPLMM